jgi:Fe2+ or Zn2+ uptake regulation protein
MDTIIGILKSKNIRVTPQRIGVYEILMHKKCHLTVEDIYREIKKKFPVLSYATVYSILELFREKDLVGEVRILPDKSCFEIKKDEPHHFFCKKCKKIFDLVMEPCPTLRHKAIDGHRIHELHGYFHGICKDCSAR